MMRRARVKPVALALPQTPCLFCYGIGTLTFTDMFSGAGGSSLGLELVRCPMCGRQLIEVTQALNHWPLAVLAHNANFPKADHDVHDVEDVPPSRFKRTDGLWASPECVNHTSCKGKRDDSPEAQRSRATFKDIVRFTAYHKYDVVIVENVVEARLWCEHEDCACGEEFDKFFRAMEDKGYEGKILYFNSQFALPTPQSRDRMYAFFWRKGLPAPMLDFCPPAWCVECTEVVYGQQTWKKASRGSVRQRIPEWGRYGANYRYSCLNEGCAQPVAPAVVGAISIIDFTIPMERIGDRRYKDGRERKLSPNTRRRISVGYGAMRQDEPIAVQVGGHLFERKGYARVWSLDEPLRTVTTTASMALVTPAGGQPAAARPAVAPMHTVIGNDRLGLVTTVGGQTGQARRSRSVAEPIGAVTTENHRALVTQTPEVAPSSDERTAPAASDGGRMLVQVNHGPKSPRDNRGGGRHLSEPTRTIAGHGELGLVEFRGDHGTVRPADVPMHTITAQGNHHGLVLAPALVYNGTPGFVRSLGDAAGTVTARDKQALLVPYNRTGVARTAYEPMGTITTRDREALVLTEAEIDDCYFRMIQWPELLKAQQMHLRPDGTAYDLTARYRNKRGKFVGLSNEHKVKMIGNAVSSPVSTMLGYAAVGILR